jgi:hypothetical protein
MPPPVADLSDDESTGESIPYDEAEDKKNGVDDANHADEDEDEDEDEDVYVVEKILGHRFKGDVRAYSALSRMRRCWLTLREGHVVISSEVARLR